jgi:hypothetical protein
MIAKRALRRLLFLAQWRCVEPVVVFESDDWGLARYPSSGLLSTLGTPGEWADEQTETPDDLAALYDVLGRYSDSNGRPACFTANFVMANPNFEAISASKFQAYYETAIAEQEHLKAAWREGVERRVLFPQYHARAHFWPQGWLRDLQEDTPGARFLFEQRCNGGLALLKGQSWRYHSEYLEWRTATQRLPDAHLDWLKGGLDLFQRLFGMSSRSTVAPHYIVTPETLQFWHTAGLEFVQGLDYRIVRQANGKPRVISHILGEGSPEGLLLLARNVKYDPRPQRSRYGWEQALRQIQASFQDSVPAIVDTHRINYSGQWRKEAIESLDMLLRRLGPYRPHFLTSVELGEAIHNGGHYRDIWNGMQRSLTPLDPPWRKALRAVLGQYQTMLMGKASSVA